MFSVSVSNWHVLFRGLSEHILSCNHTVLNAVVYQQVICTLKQPFQWFFRIFCETAVGFNFALAIIWKLWTFIQPLINYFQVYFLSAHEVPGFQPQRFVLVSQSVQVNVSYARIMVLWLRVIYLKYEFRNI